LADALARVEQRVTEGSSLAAALQAEDGLFSGVTIGIVRAGERGVGLAVALERAAVELEVRAALLARIRAALAYPLLLAGVGTASIVFITAFVVPRFVTLLGDLGTSLPLATRLLIGASDALRHFGWLLVLLGVGGVAALGQWIAAHRATWHAWLLELPLVGGIRHALATARVGRTLSTLLATGTPALAAIGVSEDAAGDAAIAERLRAARERVAEGASLSAALGATRALTEGALHLLTIGEQSGRLPALLEKAAELEEQEAERRLKVVVTALEPMLIVGFAGVVAFVAAALLQAIYGIAPR
jgi:general secretion pathway protein F